MDKLQAQSDMKYYFMLKTARIFHLHFYPLIHDIDVLTSYIYTDVRIIVENEQLCFWELL